MTFIPEFPFIQALLPDPQHLEFQQWSFEETTKQLRLTVAAIATEAACPVCQRVSDSIHSHYERTLKDIPCVNFEMTLQLQVRKFFCRNQACARRIFTERLPQVTVPWARRTRRLAERLSAMGLALGGIAGERLSQQLGYSIQDSTLLSLLARLPLPAIETPKTLGVDDFAFRKGQRYGTILVDLDRSRPIALLSDREADTLAAWLQEHPGIEVLSRDRSGSYKSGMSQGAPEAIQVADRFHLLKNLAEVLQQTFGNERAALNDMDREQRFAIAQATPGSVVLADPPPPPPQLQELAQQRREQRLECYETVWRLHQQGETSGAIAQQVGVSVRTVQRYLLMPTFPERQGRSDRGRSLLNPYKPYLLEQYNRGHRQVKVLFRAIQQQGYKGSYMTVSRYIRQLSGAQGVKLRRYPTQRRLPKVIDPPRQVLTPRQAAFLVLRHPETLSEDEQQLLQRMTQQPELANILELAQDFLSLVRQRQPEALDLWLEQAQKSEIAPFVRFAQSLQADYAEVKAGVTLATSNGPVEGHINRLKMLKRQMYGRAGLDLLQRRFLLTS